MTLMQTRSWHKKRGLVPNALRALAAMLPGLLLCACQPAAETAAPPRPALVGQPGGIVPQIGETYVGEIKARYEHVYSFRVGGKIKARFHDVGDSVAKGAPLAELDETDIALGIATARADVEVARADLAVARTEYARHKELLEKKYVGQSLFDMKQSAFELSKARTAQAQAKLDLAQNQQRYARLSADVPGVITAIAAEAGQVVQAGQPVIMLAQDDEIELAVDVPEERMGALHAGQKAVIVAAGRDDERLEGAIREIAPKADQRTRTYEVRVAFGPDARKLPLGATARAFFDVNSLAPVMVIPISALYERDARPGVWILDVKTKQVRFKPVVVGQYREEGVTILEGLAAQEWIVLAGVHKLTENQTVSPIDRDNRPIAF